MRRWVDGSFTHLLLLVCMASPFSLFAADAPRSYKVTYDGGSLPNVKGGSSLRLYVDLNTVTFVKDKTEILTIPASAITEVSYGQNVHRLFGTEIGLSKKPVVGLRWSNRDQRGILAIQCDKNDYRVILAVLAGASGKIAVNSDAQPDEVIEPPKTAYFVRWEATQSGTDYKELGCYYHAASCNLIQFNYTLCSMTLETNDARYEVHRKARSCITFKAGSSIYGTDPNKSSIDFRYRCCQSPKNKEGKEVTESWVIDSVTSLK